jgi:digeranylgeranylglycerophospholipid reductase
MTVTSLVNDVDVAVVGLGPAGASAAAIAAQAGLDVIAFDRKKIPGQPVQCAEFVPAMLGQEIHGIGAVSRQLVHRMRSFVEQQQPDETIDFRGHMIDRDRFDAQFIAEAGAMGANCEMGVGLATITGNGILELTDGRRYRPRLLIGADGPHSKVGQAIGSCNTALVETRQMTVPLLQPHDGTDIFLRADIVGGYGWLFPKGDVANLGLGVTPEARSRLKPLLAELHLSLADQGRVGRTALKYTGGAIPVGGMIRCVGELQGLPVLLVGDAAGLTNPITGAGIPAAVQSGIMAASAARAWFAGDPTAPETYREDLEDLFQASLARACLRRGELQAQYGRSKQPDAAALRRGWIAYDAYWAA